MILSCPQCAARYNLPDGAVPQGGRMLKCARCGHQWRAWPDDDLTVTVTAAAPSTVTPAPEPAAAVAETPAEAPSQPAAAPAQPPLPPAPENPATHPETTAPDLSATARLRHLPRLLSGFDGTTLLVLGGVLLMVLAGFMFWARSVPPAPQTPADATALTPTVSPTATAAGLAPVGPQPQNLQLANLTTEVTSVGKASNTLVVSGILTNLAGGSTTVPELVVELLDKNRQPLARWPAALTDTRLSPQQTTTWQATFTNPPLEKLGGYRAFFNVPAAAPSPGSDPHQ